MYAFETFCLVDHVPIFSVFDRLFAFLILIFYKLLQKITTQKNTFNERNEPVAYIANFLYLALI